MVFYIKLIFRFNYVPSSLNVAGAIFPVLKPKKNKLPLKSPYKDYTTSPRDTKGTATVEIKSLV